MGSDGAFRGREHGAAHEVSRAAPAQRRSPLDRFLLTLGDSQIEPAVPYRVGHLLILSHVLMPLIVRLIAVQNKLERSLDLRRHGFARTPKLQCQKTHIGECFIDVSLVIVSKPSIRRRRSAGFESPAQHCCRTFASDVLRYVHAEEDALREATVSGYYTFPARR